ncbi:hypothetical protein JKP88DRAFT_292367 [Tribonema minus]|uniref:Uncharacterized protein n=1 Tax=Tribonema minus TaxID=303371 RepID=A0A836CN87_9STRA|nr:hypothetical protein JKP88DRAFT_292367 [Tribonema minus]
MRRIHLLHRRQEKAEAAEQAAALRGDVTRRARELEHARQVRDITREEEYVSQRQAYERALADRCVNFKYKNFNIDDVELEHARQVRDITREEEHVSQRQAYERALADRGEVTAKLERAQEQRRALEKSLSSAEQDALRAEARRREAEGLASTVESRLEQLSAQLRQCRAKDADARIAAAELAKTHSEQVLALATRLEQLDAAALKHRDGAERARREARELQEAQARSEEFLKSVLAVNDALLPPSARGAAAAAAAISIPGVTYSRSAQHGSAQPPAAHGPSAAAAPATRLSRGRQSKGGGGAEGAGGGGSPRYEQTNGGLAPAAAPAARSQQPGSSGGGSGGGGGGGDSSAQAPLSSAAAHGGHGGTLDSYGPRPDARGYFDAAAGRGGGGGGAQRGGSAADARTAAAAAAAAQRGGGQGGASPRARVRTESSRSSEEVGWSRNATAATLGGGGGGGGSGDESGSGSERSAAAAAAVAQAQQQGLGRHMDTGSERRSAWHDGDAAVEVPTVEVSTAQHGSAAQHASDAQRASAADVDDAEGAWVQPPPSIAERKRRHQWPLDEHCNRCHGPGAAEAALRSSGGSAPQYAFSRALRKRGGAAGQGSAEHVATAQQHVSAAVELLSAEQQSLSRRYQQLVSKGARGDAADAAALRQTVAALQAKGEALRRLELATEELDACKPATRAPVRSPQTERRSAPHAAIPTLLKHDQGGNTMRCYKTKPHAAGVQGESESCDSCQRSAAIARTYPGSSVVDSNCCQCVRSSDLCIMYQQPQQPLRATALE